MAVWQIAIHGRKRRDRLAKDAPSRRTARRSLKIKHLTNSSWQSTASPTAAGARRDRLAGQEQNTGGGAPSSVTSGQHIRLCSGRRERRAPASPPAMAAIHSNFPVNPCYVPCSLPVPNQVRPTQKAHGIEGLHAFGTKTDIFSLYFSLLTGIWRIAVIGRTHSRGRLCSTVLQ
jgi:hypothetical protein